MSEMVIENDFIGQTPSELTLKKGDVVKDVTQWLPDWYKGTINNKNGIFPKSCVAKDVTLRKKDAGPTRCRVVYSYNRDHDDELSLKVGDIIEVLGEEEEGWWRGVLNGREGVFPSNFVEEITKSPIQCHPDKIGVSGEVEVKSPSLPPKPVKTICEVKYPYKAQNEDELTLKEGDQITLISKDVADAGWWKGELNGRIGVFPDNFVVIVSPLPQVEEKPREETPSITKSWIPPDTLKTTSQRTSIESNVSGKNPPIPAKKPTVPMKKSPSSGGGGILQGLRKKLEGIEKKDVVDGGASSKNKYEVKSKKREDENQNAFDQVERNSILKDVRAGRAKPPSRRPPTSANKDDDNKDILETSSESDVGAQEIQEIKPQVREWERHKAPWLEEMKINQAKRSSTSPGPEIRKTNHEMEDIKIKAEKESPSDMSKSMPVMSSKRIKSPLEPDHLIKPSNPRLKPTNDTDSNLTNNVNIFHHTDKKLDTKCSEISNNISHNETISYKQYIELAQKVEVLERLVERQNEKIAQHHHMHQTQIEELHVKLAAEVKQRLALENELEKLTREHLNI